MPELIFLGTAAAVPDQEHENTQLALRYDAGVVLIDCSGSPLPRLARAGIDQEQVTDIILTHFHPDHVGGIPLLLMNMWLLGRKAALRIYGLHHCLERVEDMMGFFHWENWPRFFPVAFHRLPEQPGVQVLEHGPVRILASSVRHVIPTIGLRVEVGGQPVLAYSCDTEPCPAVVELARGAPTLIHEATGEGVGHSSAAQAGGIAVEAGVRQLYLIHYTISDGVDEEALRREAAMEFEGEVIIARDWMRIDLGGAV
ncbi:MAG: MBL fold metallo-hydrolase [Anaerolineales bacterium]